jgi:hypothetical protein
MVSFLLTQSHHNQWYHPDNLGFYKTNLAAASWQHQWTGADATPAPDGTWAGGRAKAAYPWNITRADSSITGYWWDIGGSVWNTMSNDIPDSCGFDGCVSSKAFAYPAVRYFDITRPVQGILLGEPNHGIGIGTVAGNNTADRDITYIAWSQVTDGDIYAPWVEIDLLVAPYRSPFPNGREVAFVFTTDDGRDDANIFYSAVIDSFNTANGTDWNMTICIVEDYVGSSPSTLLDWSEVYDLCLRS